MATAPDPRARARQRNRANNADGDGAVVVVVNGDRYPLRFDGLSVDEIRECRRVTGMSPQGIVRALRTDPDLDLIAALMWLSKRQAGERVDFDEIAAGLDYTAELDVRNELAAEDKDPESPEA